MDHLFGEKERPIEEPLRLSLDFDGDVFVHAEDIRKRKMILTVEGRHFDPNDTEKGLCFEASIEGLFVVPEQMEKERQDSLLQLNGASMLYGTLRGILITVSALMPEGRLCLPALLPQDILRRITETKERNSNRTPPEKHVFTTEEIEEIIENFGKELPLEVDKKIQKLIKERASKAVPSGNREPDD